MGVKLSWKWCEVYGGQRRKVVPFDIECAACSCMQPLLQYCCAWMVRQATIQSTTKLSSEFIHQHCLIFTLISPAQGLIWLNCSTNQCYLELLPPVQLSVSSTSTLAAALTIVTPLLKFLFPFATCLVTFKDNKFRKQYIHHVPVCCRYAVKSIV